VVRRDGASVRSMIAIGLEGGRRRGPYKAYSLKPHYRSKQNKKRVGRVDRRAIAGQQGGRLKKSLLKTTKGREEGAPPQGKKSNAW